MSDAPLLINSRQRDPLPEPVQSSFNPGMLNEPILLASGLTRIDCQGSRFDADVQFRLSWLPKPSVRFDIAEAPEGMHPALAGISFELPDGTQVERNMITRLGVTTASEVYRSAISGLTNQLVIRPKDAEVNDVRFFLPNFQSIIGKGLQYPDGSQRAARLTLDGGAWTITLDELNDCKYRIESLRANSGFAVTHIGRLERTDGKAIVVTDARRILQTLHWYISFCSGRWTGPCLPMGFDPSGLKIWETWDYHRTSPYHQPRSWMDDCHRECFENPFPGFLSLWQDDNWEEVIRLAIHWHVEANAQAGSIEGAIVLTQTAFELLASAVLVENNVWLSTDGYEKLTAADRIRLLFRWVGIPTDIPSSLTSLTLAAKADNWLDSPTAMTMVRNTITHPTKKNREKFGKHSHGVRVDVWSLGLWALELCLLRLFAYSGKYANRIKQKYVGEVEDVPWVTGIQVHK